MRRTNTLLLVLALLAVPSTAVANYQSTVTADSPSAYWRLGEASGTNANDEIGTNDGTLAPGAMFGGAGALAGSGDSNGAVNLDGSQGKVAIGNPSRTGSFTLEEWIYCTGAGTTGSGAFSTIMGYSGTRRLLLKNNDGSIWAQIGTGTTQTATGVASNNAWHHIAFVYDAPGGTRKVYVDGAQAASDTAAGSPTWNAAFWIGAYEGTATNYAFKGRIDEPAIYGSALSATQIAAHYTAGTTGGGAAAHYYVSPTGSNSNNGTSSSTPWQTIAKVNAHAFVPGDEVSFQGGQSFTGQITPGSGGTSTSRIVFDSYGTGRATITNTGSGAGLFIGAFGGVTVQDLNFTGPGVGSSTNDGIVLYQATGSRITPPINIRRVNSTAWKGGISVGGATKGYDGVTVEDAELYGDRDYGFTSYGPTFTGSNYANANITVRRSNAYSNLGNPLNTTTHTGDGIAVGATDGGLIELCSAHDNGVNNTASEGPVGLWTYDSNAVTIRRSVSYSNHTSGANDGGGFDIDQNVTNALLEDDLAWGNDGYGFVVSAGGGGSSNNTFSGVSSVGNDRDGNAGAELLLFATTSSLEIKNSTFLAQDAGSSHPRDLGLGTVGGATLTGVTVHDNMLVETGTGALVDANSNYTTSQVVFNTNGYHRVGGFLVRWPTATTYTSRATWSAATGQEPG